MSPTATNAAVILCLFKWKDWGLSLTNQFKQAVTVKRDTHILNLPQALQEICDFGIQIQYRSIKVN